MEDKLGIRFQLHPQTVLDTNKITDYMNGTVHFCASYMNPNLDHFIVTIVKENLH
jgi:hypothetical protein